MKSIINTSKCLASLAVVALATGCVTDGGPRITSGTTTSPGKKVDWLFVQNAEGLSTGKGTITLRGVNPQTIAFSDRPDRVAGHMPTKNFIPFWSEGDDSFKKNPPNATLSVLRGKDVESTVVTISNPRLANGNLTYDATVLEGSLPKSSGPCSLFIDIIGRPLTPMSYAGVARRTVRRGAYAAPYYAAPVYAAPYYGPTVVHYGPYGTTVVRP